MTASSASIGLADQRQLAGQIAAYEGLLWGQCLDDSQAEDLRTLARVFDIEAGPDISLAGLWGLLRPLLEGLGMTARAL